jgi:predicted transcriptional regulator of viral defense system
MKYEKKPIADILRLDRSVFTFQDIAIIWGGTDQRAIISAINYYIKRGALYRIRQGIYAKDKNYSKYELATKIFTPSYISFETVLAKAGMIFQYYGQIFIASYLSREIIVDDQTYTYMKITDPILVDHAGIIQEKNFAIASPERAFLDLIYLNKDYYFDNLTNLNWDKVFELMPIYKHNKTMLKKVKQYRESEEKT